MPAQGRADCSWLSGRDPFPKGLLLLHRLGPGPRRSQAPGSACCGDGWKKPHQKMAHRLPSAPLPMAAGGRHQNRSGPRMPHCQKHWREAFIRAPLRMQRLPLRESPALLREGRRDETGCIYGSCQCLSSSLRLKPRNQKRVL